MTQYTYMTKTRALTWGVWAALVVGTAPAVAQDTPPPAAEPAPEAPMPEVTTTAVTTSAPADLTSEVAALREEVAALKTKQEEAETAALLAETPTESSDEADKLRIYGFMDFGFDKFIGPANSTAALVRPGTAGTFVFGNLNLYIDATPVEHLRCLTEFRLTIAPHGEETSLIGQYERIDTTAFDFASPSSQFFLRMSGLFIERAWSEYEFSKGLRIQAGLFLNPFGIWNLDHGSPTLIALQLPTFISAQMVPTRLLGLHAYGSQFFGNSELGYALHVTNGRGPIDFDYSDDKALGGRLYYALDGDFGRFVLGASGYWGTYVDQHRAVSAGAGGLELTPVRVEDYTEQVLGFDVAFDTGGLRLRAESVLRWIDYEAGKAEKGLGAGGTSEFLPNRTEWSGYALAAYRTPWRLEPYLMAESSVNKAAILPRWAGEQAFSTPNSATIALSVGVNVELTTHTILKSQLVWVRAYDRHFENKSLDVGTLFVRLVNTF